MEKIPKRERALILQGGGSLGAYEAGSFKAGYDLIKYRDKKTGESERPVFDIVAGTSIGAINSAILASYVVENGTWEGSSDRLIDFWNYISTDSLSDVFSNYMLNWWEYSRKFFADLATGEAARRYYSSKEFLATGVSKVFSPPHIVPDKRFCDMSNMWFQYDNRPLKQSLEKFAKFPIATSHEDDQPRLLLTAVDVMDGIPVIFDSYTKGDGTRKSEYGKLIMDRNDDKNNEHNAIGFEHVIKYDAGITSEHVLASASSPVNYDYIKLNAERYESQTKRYIKETRYFWDGGILVNTPLTQVVVSQRNYWYYDRKVRKAVPKLDILEIDLHPSRLDKIPRDRDGALNRKDDIMFSDRTKNDETVLLLFQSYTELAKRLIKVARDHGVKQEIIDDILDKSIPAQERFVGVRGKKYRDGIEGAFNIGEVLRVERKHDENSISNKAFDFSSNTIKRLLQEGYNDTIDQFSIHFGSELLAASGMPLKADFVKN